MNPKKYALQPAAIASTCAAALLRILSYMAGYPAYSRGSYIVYACLLVNVLLDQRLLTVTSDPKRIGVVTLMGSLPVNAIWLRCLFSNAPWQLTSSTQRSCSLFMQR